ncbi:protein lev-9-like isoform X1 [Mytilus trossulus]
MMEPSVILLSVLFIFTAVVTCNQPKCDPRKDNVNRKCQKPCALEACKSKRKDCLCDGDCGLSCINKNMKCEPIGSIQYGEVTVLPYNKFAAIARYQCHEGYEIHGKHQRVRVCQGDGQWSLSPPECRININQSIQAKAECGKPPVVSHAHHDGEIYQTTFDIGSMLQYTCDTGNTGNTNDISRAWCVGAGIWVGPKMTCSSPGCPRPRSIDNGRVKEPFKNSFGNEMEYECNEGYFLTGRRMRTCLANGTWDGQEPSCETVTCQEPPKILNAVHDGYDESSLYPAGRQVTYECIKGYRQNDGHPRAMCNGDGEWVGLSQFACGPVNCGFPVDIKDGWREGHMFEYKNQVKYNCKQGYKLHGDMILTCEADETWTGEVPECIPVECPHLNLPRYGTIIGSGNAYGTVLSFECMKGFKHVGPVERRCQENGQWSGDDVTCTEVNCGWPKHFDNGYLLGQKTSVGSVIFYSCDVRTNFDGTSFKSTCLENGTWSHPPPLCLGQCLIPSIPDATLNGQPDQREGVWARHGIILNYQCKSGLVPDDTRPVRCNNGTWTSRAKCTPAACKGPPPHIDNGLRIFEGLKHNHRAKYICRNGFQLLGITDHSPYLICLYGSWSGGTPKCKEFYCPNPAVAAPLENGKIYKRVNNGKFQFQKYITTIRHGTRLLFICDPGFIRKGPSGATCVNGTWSPGIDNPGTKCEEQNHPEFPKLWMAEEEKNSEIP